MTLVSLRSSVSHPLPTRASHKILPFIAEFNSICLAPARSLHRPRRTTFRFSIFSPHISSTARTTVPQQQQQQERTKPATAASSTSFFLHSSAAIAPPVCGGLDQICRARALPSLLHPLRDLPAATHKHIAPLRHRRRHYAVLLPSSQLRIWRNELCRPGSTGPVSQSQPQPAHHHQPAGELRITLHTRPHLVGRRAARRCVLCLCSIRRYLESVTLLHVGALTRSAATWLEMMQT